MAPGFIAIGSGPAGLSAAETFRSKHPHISVRILTTHVPGAEAALSLRSFADAVVLRMAARSAAPRSSSVAA